MKCRHLTQSGHCAEVEHRPPCTARLCPEKNAARPLHLETLKRMATRQQRAEYPEALDGAEGKTAGMMVRGEFMDWWERRNGATSAPEAAGGAQTCAELPADVSGEKTAQIAGNLEQGN